MGSFGIAGPDRINSTADAFEPDAYYHRDYAPSNKAVAYNVKSNDKV